MEVISVRDSLLTSSSSERAYNPAAPGGCVSEVGVSVLDLNELTTSSGDIQNIIKSYHTLVQGRENLHPSPETEARMGIPSEFALKPRSWFIYGMDPWNTRTIRIRNRQDDVFEDVSIAEATEINPVTMLGAWVKAKVAVTPSRGSIGFPSNPPRRIAWNM